MAGGIRTVRLDGSDFNNWGISQTIKEIKIFEGDSVEVKGKSLRKFGFNSAVGTSSTTIMEFLGSEVNETYPSGNSIGGLVTNDSAFTGLCKIEGHTVDANGDLTFVVQSKSANGTTAVTLDTPLYRATRVYNDSNESLSSAGAQVYVYRAGDTTVTNGVPDTAAAVNVLFTGVDNQSNKASTALSSKDYWLVNRIHAAVDKKTAGGANVRLQVREKGKVFRTIFESGINSTGPNLDFEFSPPLYIKPNSDIRVIAEADQASTPVSATIQGALALIKDVD